MIRIQTLGCLSIRGEDGKVLTGAAAQPRRMAILALLARAGDRGVSRDKLRALLWPDSDDERGSRTLSQALYALKKDLADDAITGAKEIRLDPALVTSDVAEFTAAVSRGDDERAAEAYAGPFLDGFHVPAAEEFARWADRERGILAQEYGRVLESLARSALTRGNATASVGWWRKLAAIDPLNARATIGLMEALAAAGDRASAIKQARIYEMLVEQELDLPPDREVTSLAERLRLGHDEPPAMAADDGEAGRLTTLGAPLDSPAAGALPDPEHGQRELTAEAAPRPAVDAAAAGSAHTPSRRPWMWWAVAVTATASVAVLAARWTRRPEATPNETGTVIAVGRIVSYGTDSSAAALVRPVADLLATSLARSPNLRVLSAERMLELIHRRTPGDTSATALADAARTAGVTEIVDGTLYTRQGGWLRLDLRRIDLASGTIRDVRSIEGRDLFALVDSGTARLLAAHGSAAPGGSIAGLTTRSAAAYGLYAEGVRRLADGDEAEAERLFAAALREDSTFAMAAFYYGRTTSARVPLVKRLNLALRLSAQTTERERLLIRAGWAWKMTSPALLALADSLVRRYPQETEGHLYAGIALVQQGEFLAGIAPLRRVVTMDSLSFTRAGSRVDCTACTAMEQIVLAYELADSLDAAEREARRWTRMQPDAVTPWLAVWDALERAGKFAAADTVAARTAALDHNPVAAMARASTHALRTGDLATSERLARTALQAGTSAAEREALWQLILALRYQGRLAEALSVARRYRSLAAPLDSGGPGTVSSAAVPAAVVLYESGRYREAAALFDSTSRPWGVADEPPSVEGRERAWRLAQEARALAAAGDTTRLAELADTIAALGQLSIVGRDRRLADHVRGLLLLARNNLGGAEAAFRSAMFSSTSGYTRINCDLALVLLRLGRPMDAVRVLEPALHGKLDASNYHVTHTELHALLAQAWDAAGRADSAAAHHAWVARAWERGDPQFAARAAEARRHLDQPSSRRTASRER